MTKRRIDSSEVMDMKSGRNLISSLLPGLAMTVLILDAKTALTGAQSGLELCIRMVIPSLFPFIFLSILVTGSLMGQCIPLLQPLGRLCRIPSGTEGLLAVGLVGGYPVGAQAVTQAYREGSLSREDAHRLLGFCSNAGPSFIFGMLGGIFSDPLPLWILWGIHILSAVLTGILLPGGSESQVRLSESASPALPGALERSLKVMGSICGWVILFRVLLSFLQRWFLWALPQEAGILLSGLLELTNGCCRLQLVDTEGLRFLLSSVLLGFGGICVGLQTVSVTKGLGTGLYFPGKILQCALSFLLAYPVQLFLFPVWERFSCPSAALCFCLVPVAGVVLKILKIPGSILARQGV